MAAPISIDDPTLSLKIFNSVGLVAGSDVVVETLKALRVFNNSVSGGLKKFTFSKVGNTTNYDYQVEANDDRIWDQVIKIETVVLMTFSVEEFWVVEEFIPNGRLRDLVIELVKLHQVTKITANWS